MTSERYTIILTDTLQAGRARPDVQNRLAALFKVDAARVEQLLKTPAPVIKTGLSKETALKYQQAIERTGACCRIVSETPVAPPTPSQTPHVPEKAQNVIYRARITRNKVGAYKYVMWPFVRLKNAAEYIFDHLAGMIWQELMGKAPNYSQVAQFAAFLVFSLIAYTLWYIPEYSYKFFLTTGFILWLVDRFLTKRAILQTPREIQITLKHGAHGMLVWRRKYPSGEADMLQFERHEIAELTVMREMLASGAFDVVTGAVWRLYVTLHDGAVLLLDEHADILQTLKRARQMAQHLDVPVVFEHSEGASPFAAKTVQAVRKPGSSGHIVMQRGSKAVTLTAAWNLNSVGTLVNRMLRRSGFLIFLLMVEGFMVKYGLLLNWLINPYLGLDSPDFPIELSFTGVFSLFAPENDWKEWLKLGLILALMLYQGFRMSRKKSVSIAPDSTAVVVGNRRLATLSTRQVDFPLLFTEPLPYLLFMDEQQAAQLGNFQTADESRAFTAAVEQALRDVRKAHA